MLVELVGGTPAVSKQCSGAVEVAGARLEVWQQCVSPNKGLLPLQCTMNGITSMCYWGGHVRLMSQRVGTSAGWPRS